MGRPRKYDEVLLAHIRAAGSDGKSLLEIEAEEDAVELNARSLKSAAARLFQEGHLVRQFELVDGGGYIFRQYRYWETKSGPAGAERA